MEFASFINGLSQTMPIFLLIQAKISGLVGILFYFRKEWVSRRILLSTTLVLSYFVLQTQPLHWAVDTAHYLLLVMGLLQQLLEGVLIGLTINFFVEVFLMLGQFISMQAGLGFVNLYMPRLGNITPLTNFFIITSAVIFFEMNGHLILFKMLIQSFSYGDFIKIAGLPDKIFQVISYSKFIFNSSVMLSLSVVISLLLSNFTIGIVTKFSPQINIFSIGINISIIVGFFACYLSYDLILDNGEILLNELIDFSKKVLS